MAPAMQAKMMTNGGTVMAQQRSLGRVAQRSQQVAQSSRSAFSQGLQGAFRGLSQRRLLSQSPRAANVAVLRAAEKISTVSETKERFLAVFPKPLPALYSTIIQELLVQHHLIKYSPKHQFDKVHALGFISVFDGIMDSFPGDKEEVLAAYLAAIEEDAATFRSAAEELTAFAQAASGADALVASDALAASGNYNKFQAIGCFRLLELVGATDPASLEKLTSSLSLPLTRVTSDLATYKGMLSKMTAAKELMAEIIAEQRKKSAQREAEKLKQQEEANSGSASNGELPNGGTPAAT
mmetsp:Transcript_35353/g.76782  ORF Transcript_35353/g.76782 Transcript_35353/m.76782 type:complete len:296 (+) Transcript_35353:150-1037(+)